MTTDFRARYADRARFMKALAHPTRLFIVDELALAPRCVCELVALIGDDTSTVSKHLTVLKNAGIVTDRKRGTMVIYSLAVPCLRSFFACYEATQHARAAASTREPASLPDAIL